MSTKNCGYYQRVVINSVYAIIIYWHPLCVKSGLTLSSCLVKNQGYIIHDIFLPIDRQSARQEFVKFCAYCLRFSQYLPMIFIIGFFVSTIVGRWWDQFCSLPNPEQIAMKLANFLPSKVIQSISLFQPLCLFILAWAVYPFICHTSLLYRVHSSRCSIGSLLQPGCPGKAGIPSYKRNGML